MRELGAKVLRRIDHRFYLVRRDLNRFIPHPCIDLGGDHHAAVLLAGSGRSGTTWVPQLINYRNEFRYVTEPFNPGNCREVQHWKLRQYIRPDDQSTAFVEPAARIFSGKVRSGWTEALNRKLIARRRLVKDVLITLSLKWVRNRFAGMPIVFLLRHPCAVAASRRHLEWPTNLEDQFYSQPALMQDHLEPLRDRLAGLRTTFERHIAFWCVENFVPLRQLEEGDVHLLFYERLCADPPGELSKLFAFLALPPDPSAALKKFGRPSFQARKYVGGGASAVLTGTSLTDAWREYVTADELARACEILSWFGLDRIYGSESFPNVAAAEAMLRPAPSLVP